MFQFTTVHFYSNPFWIRKVTSENNPFMQLQSLLRPVHNLCSRRLRYDFSPRNLYQLLLSFAAWGSVVVKALLYRDSDKSLARPTTQCILFDGENISFDASLVIYINSTNIPPIMIINKIYEHQNLLSL